MTNEEAIEACIKHKFEVLFSGILGTIEVSKSGQSWIGPSDIGGYGSYGRHRLSRSDTFSEAVGLALAALPHYKFKETP